VITGSDEPEWVRPLATLRPRGLGCAVVLLDAPTFSVPPAPRTGEPAPEPDPEAAQAMRATRHRLAEFDLRTITVRADERLGEVLA
jgi:hypothetical protein